MEILLKEKLDEIKTKLKTEASAEAKAATPNLKDLEAEISDALKPPKSQVSDKGSPAGAIDTLVEREELKTKILEELKDRNKREKYLKILVETGKKKFAKSSKIVKAVDNFAKGILWPKPLIDKVLSSTPHAAPAALPWAGVCFGLEVSKGLFP